MEGRSWRTSTDRCTVAFYSPSGVAQGLRSCWALLTLLNQMNLQSEYGAGEARTPSGWSPAGCGPHPPPLVATSPQSPLARPRSGTSPSWALATAGPSLRPFRSRARAGLLGDPIDHPSEHWKCRKNRSYRPHASQVRYRVGSLSWTVLDVALRRNIMRTPSLHHSLRNPRQLWRCRLDVHCQKERCIETGVPPPNRRGHWATATCRRTSPD
jgi:hypothetical protein